MVGVVGEGPGGETDQGEATKSSETPSLSQLEGSTSCPCDIHRRISWPYPSFLLLEGEQLEVF